MKRSILLCACALLWPFAAFASPVAEQVKGDVQAGDKLIAMGARLEVPTSVSTGAGSQVFLRFDDGMQVVLAENSLMRVLSFRYTGKAGEGIAALELLRGSARIVTGRLAVNNPKQFFVHTQHAQLQVDRPSDFTVALVNPAYITVNAGSVLASNGAGVSTLTAGSTSVIASNAVAAASIPASAIPASAASSMSTLSVASVAAPAGGGAATGVGVAAGTAGGTAFAVAVPVVVVGAVVAGVAAASANNDDLPQATATHH